MFEKAVKLADSFLDMGIPGYDMIIFHDGKEVFRHMNGYADAEAKIPVGGKERYDIYSCSKPLTVTAALQLWERGLYSFEDKLSDYMPEFEKMTVRTPEGIVPAKNPILIKHLFEMTAGFNYATSSPSLKQLRVDTAGACPTREAMRYLAREPLDFEPGERWQYSLCHDVLAALVEVISGERFSEYVKANIFDRLGMEHSTFRMADEDFATVAAQYRYDSKQNVRLRIGSEIQSYRFGYDYESGGAGCVSTVEDYILFLEALREGEVLLRRGTVATMTTNRLSVKQRATYWTRETHGYGLGVRCPKAGGGIREFGWGGAAGCYLAVDIPNHLTLFFAEQVLNPPNNALRPLLYNAAVAEYTPLAPDHPLVPLGAVEGNLY